MLTLTSRGGLLLLALGLLLGGCACALQTAGMVAGVTVSALSGDPAPATIAAVDLLACTTTCRRP